MGIQDSVLSASWPCHLLCLTSGSNFYDSVISIMLVKKFFDANMTSKACPLTKGLFDGNPNRVTQF